MVSPELVSCQFRKKFQAVARGSFESPPSRSWVMFVCGKWTIPKLASLELVSCRLRKQRWALAGGSSESRLSLNQLVGAWLAMGTFRTPEAGKSGASFSSPQKATALAGGSFGRRPSLCWVVFVWKVWS
jgi:hypothetical protein